MKAFACILCLQVPGACVHKHLKHTVHSSCIMFFAAIDGAGSCG